MNNRRHLFESLVAAMPSLPSLVLEDHFRLRPDMKAAYTDHQKENFRKDVSWIMMFLSESVLSGHTELFDEFVLWLKTFLTSVRVPMKDVAESFELIRNRLVVGLDDNERMLINKTFDNAVSLLLEENIRLSLPATGNNLSPTAGSYLSELLEGRRDSAMTIINSEVEKGLSIKEIYLNIFQPVQYEIGRLWQMNRISVAQEHYCTAATQVIMARLYPLLFTGERKPRKLVTVCVPGELHEVGARMVTDFFEMDGWDTYYLGANTPVEGVVRYLENIRPDCLAISTTMVFHLSSVEKMIRQVRENDRIPPAMKIIVGGYPFRIAGDLWKEVGADGFGNNALEAVGVAANLTAT